MKNKPGTVPVSPSEKTNPVLLGAHALMKIYAMATGASVTVHDRNLMIIPEQLEYPHCKKNVCLFCIRYREHVEAQNTRDMFASPCRELHVNALRESHRFGGSYTYVCALGFMFWTSPICVKGRFSGAVLGSGFLGTDREEICGHMHSLCGGAKTRQELNKLLSVFPRGEPRKIKALAEILFICAQSLSDGSEDSHESMKRRARQQMDLTVRISGLKTQYPRGSKRPEYPMDKEQQLFGALLRGDSAAGREILNEILAILFYSNPHQFKHIQYRAIELAVLLSRVNTVPGTMAKTILETNNRHLKMIQETNNIEDLADVLYRIIDYLADQVFSFQGIEHASALKKAEHFILENFTRKISLEEIAKDSGFSAPYFSTIFKEEMGENLSSYLNRLRMQKAGRMLTKTNYSLSKIAHACGFNDQSWFSKIFRAFTGISPGKYRNREGKQEPRIPEITFSDSYRLMISKGAAE